MIVSNFVFPLLFRGLPSVLALVNELIYIHIIELSS